ncbi:MAG: NAD(P)-dependent oxidoreductase, partial [Myxococcales bacterium]
MLRGGGFHGWSPTHWFGAQLAGSTLGIVGLGRIGRAVAERARAFGMRVLYTGRTRHEALEPALQVSWRSLDALLAESDYLSLHCPLTPATRHLVDAAALARMKRTAVLVNTARGPLVDEEALARALHDGRIGGAGLDVFEDEPRVHPLLLTAPNAVLVPHIGTSTLPTRVAMADRAVADVLRVLDGDAPRFAVNRPAAPRAGKGTSAR